MSITLLANLWGVARWFILKIHPTVKKKRRYTPIEILAITRLYHFWEISTIGDTRIEYIPIRLPAIMSVKKRSPIITVFSGLDFISLRTLLSSLVPGFLIEW